MNNDKIKEEAICDLIKDVTTNLSHLNRLDDKNFPDDKKCYKNTSENRMKMKGDCFECPSNLQTIHTPTNTCSEIVGKLREYIELDNKEICVFNLEFLSVLKYNNNVPLDKVWFVTDCQNKAKVARYLGVNVIEENMEIFLMSNPRKFDVICMNPPYHAPRDRKTEAKTGVCGATLWDKFIEMAIKITNDDGFIVSINPALWRKPENKLYNTIVDNGLIYVEIHSMSDGLKTFNSQTGYDCLFIKKGYKGKITIKDQDGIESDYVHGTMPFIPNFMIKEIMDLIAKNDEESVDLMWDCTYHTQSKTKAGTISKEKTDKFKYPCIYGITNKDGVKIWYSSVDNGHFGIPKVIMPISKSTYAIVDENGEYGICQFAFAIKISSKEEGDQLKEFLLSEKMNKIFCANEWAYNTKNFRFLKFFKKDFWKIC